MGEELGLWNLRKDDGGRGRVQGEEVGLWKWRQNGGVEAEADWLRSWMKRKCVSYT